MEEWRNRCREPIIRATDMLSTALRVHYNSWSCCAKCPPRICIAKEELLLAQKKLDAAIEVGYPVLEPTASEKTALSLQLAAYFGGILQVSTCPHGTHETTWRTIGGGIVENVGLDVGGGSGDSEYAAELREQLSDISTTALPAMTAASSLVELHDEMDPEPQRQDRIVLPPESAGDPVAAPGSGILDIPLTLPLSLRASADFTSLDVVCRVLFTSTLMLGAKILVALWLQGDILISVCEWEPSMLPQSLPSLGRPWTGGRIFVTIDEDSPSAIPRQVIEAAVQHMNDTFRGYGVQWVRQPWDTHAMLQSVVKIGYYPSIAAGNWCEVVGMRGGQTRVSLEAGVATGSIYHELLHAAGLFHEHCRHDAKRYLTIHIDNVEQTLLALYQFRPLPILRSTVSRPYNYSSIMHYSAWAFGRISGVVTLRPVDGDLSKIGQRITITPGDLRAIVNLYAEEVHNVERLGMLLH